MPLTWVKQNGSWSGFRQHELRQVSLASRTVEVGGVHNTAAHPVAVSGETAIFIETLKPAWGGSRRGHRPNGEKREQARAESTKSFFSFLRVLASLW